MEEKVKNTLAKTWILCKRVNKGHDLHLELKTSGSAKGIIYVVFISYLYEVLNVEMQFLLC